MRSNKLASEELKASHQVEIYSLNNLNPGWDRWKDLGRRTEAAAVFPDVGLGRTDTRTPNRPDGGTARFSRACLTFIPGRNRGR